MTTTQTAQTTTIDEAHAEALVIDEQIDSLREDGEWRYAWRLTVSRAEALADEGLEAQEWEYDHRHDDDWWD